jgi:hypothetical protein
LCFNCDEKYSRGHNKVCKRLFLLDSVDDEGDDVDEDPEMEAPVFSLHAVAGVPVGRSILLRVVLGAATFVALVDTGSSHNFIGEAAAQRTGLDVQPRPRLTATVANGEKVSCPGVIRRAPLSIEGMAFHVDLYVMPLAGYDIVLGTQWMAQLGSPIAWDVTERVVTFTQNGRPVRCPARRRLLRPRCRRRPRASPSSTVCSTRSPTCSRSPRDSRHRKAAPTASSSSRVRLRWLCVPTGTRRRTRMSSNDNAPP